MNISNKTGIDMLNCSVSGQSICAGTTTAGYGSTITGENALVTSTAVPTYNITTTGIGLASLGGGTGTLWGYWQDFYYPQIIRESYPVYIQDKAMDKGKHAFELIKALMDKKLLNVEKVKDFIEAMDTVLKAL